MWWTPEQDAMLRQLASEGYYAAQVANMLEAKFCCGFNKNKVIGRGARLHPKVEWGNKPIGGAEANARRLAARRVQARARRQLAKLRNKALLPLPEFVEPPIPASAPPSLDVAVLDLQEQHCRFPNTQQLPHRFCGAARYNGSSYCLFHDRLTRGRDR